MIKLLFISLLVLGMGCDRKSKKDQSAVLNSDSILIAAKESENKQLTGKWRYTSKGPGAENDNQLFIIFNKDNVATLNGPDSEFERIKWKIKKDKIIITGLKKGEDSRWTFRDSVFQLAFSESGKKLELSGKRQTFLLKKL